MTNIDQSNNLTPTVTLSNPFPNGLLQPVGNAQGLLTGVGGPITFNSQDRHTERIQQYSIEVQRQIGNMAVGIGYIGTRGDDLNFGTININQLTPDLVAQWGSRSTIRCRTRSSELRRQGHSRGQRRCRAGSCCGRTHNSETSFRIRPRALLRDNAVTAKLEKRGKPWSGNLHYTWSRLDTNQYNEGNLYYTTVRQTLPRNSYDLDAEYSRSLQDLPHRIVLAPIVQLPFGEGRRWATTGWADQVFGAWDLSFIATYESGFPVNIVQLTDNTGSFSGTQRPNWSGTDPATSGSTIDRLDGYINQAAYTLAPAFTFGTGPRTRSHAARMPFRTNYDVSLSRTSTCSPGCGRSSEWRY